jgi:hypothetical protein
MKSFTISATLALGAFSVQIKQMAVDAAQYEIENRLDAIGVDTYVIQDELDKLADYTQEKGDDAWDTA